VAAIAYRAPTRPRPLSRKTVGARLAGARAAAIAFAEGPELRASWIGPHFRNDCQARPKVPSRSRSLATTNKCLAKSNKSGTSSMSGLGHKRTSRHPQAMSALLPKADMARCHWHVRLVPQADICSAANALAIRSPRRRARRLIAPSRSRVIHGNGSNRHSGSGRDQLEVLSPEGATIPLRSDRLIRRGRPA
jgi:hypothetical protein